ncbi:MAG: DsbA family oxidoreductase [Methylotenera sp.]|nr:DsbA family oxidoreductase [Oligoflexia bacterium]
MQIQVWSDIVCPFCYIGKRHLEEALSRFEHRDQVSVHWKSFELDPSAELNPTLSLAELLSKKYQKPLEWAHQAHAQMTKQAKAVGLDYHFEKAKHTNTFDAHRLIHFAEKTGGVPLQGQMKERLLQAYYTRGEHVGDLETLARIAAEVGMNPEAVLEFLKTDDFAVDVRRDEEEAQESGVRGVPFFVLNGKYTISGAQPVEMFERALKAAWEDRETWPRVEQSGAVCGPDGCAI